MAMNTCIEACLYSQAHYGVGGSFDSLNALQQWEAAGVLPVNRVSEIFIICCLCNEILRHTIYLTLAVARFIFHCELVF